MKRNQIRQSLMLLIIAVFIGIIFSAGCTSPAGKTTGTDAGAGAGVMSPVEKVEVYHFHPTNGCRSCTIMGEYAEETVKTYFPAELKNGKIIFDHIDYQQPENEKLVKLYEVTGSSLMIGVYNQTVFNRESNHNVWYMTGNKTQYMNYLKEVIDLRLAGDLS